MAGESGSDSLSASMTAGSDIVYDLHCEICDGKHLEAEGFCVDCSDYLCNDCFKGHKSSKFTKTHVLQDKSQMPRQKPSPVTTKTTKGICTEKCACNPDRLIEYYCRDDKTLGCSVCMTMKHRLCDGVDHIPDLSEHLLETQEYNTFTNSLRTIKAKSMNIIQKSVANVSKAEKYFTETGQSFKVLRSKVNAAFDMMEGDMQKKAGEIKSADINKMNAAAAEGKRVIGEIDKISADLQILQSKNYLGQIFIEMVKLEDKVDAFQKLLTKTAVDDTITTYTVDPGFKIRDILNDPSSICKLSVKASEMAKPLPTTIQSHLHVTPAASNVKQAAMPQPKGKDMTDIKPVKENKINVKTESDTCECQVVGSALMPYNKLVLTDSNNKKVKLIDLNTSKVTSELNTSPWPMDVTNISGDLIAYTVPDRKKIVYVAVDFVTDKLTTYREMKVRGECEGIQCNNGKLIVAFSYPKKVEIMSLDGTVAMMIEHPDLFQLPSHLTLGLGQDTLYVTDSAADAVFRIDTSGAIRAVYKDQDFVGARGIAVDQHGRVIVCGSYSIQMLQPDLTKVKVLVDGLVSAQSLSYNRSTGKLYLGDMSNSLKVYRLLE